MFLLGCMGILKKFKGVSIKSQGCFEAAPRKFEGSLNDVLSISNTFQDFFKIASRVFQVCIKVV